MRREERIKEAYQRIREILPTAIISIKEHPGIPGVGSHYYIEVDP